MKELISFLQLDIKLLHRNNLFVLAAVVAVIYIGVFYLLKPLGDLTNILIVLIFNDPVVTGYLFAAVLLLFDKNQNTLQAYSILPVGFYRYFISKIILLSVLATVVAFIMTIATRGFDFNPAHLFAGTFLSTFMFACCGFIVGALVKTFNQLLIYSVPIFILSAIPFLYIFGVGESYYSIIIFTWGGIQLLKASLIPEQGALVGIYYLHLIIFTFIFWKLTIHVSKKMQL
ncbi:MAG: fluoroquinolone export ABC transporter permease subunit [Candidatus Cyclobacteriaceae bacterium M2_1C_046]